MRRRVALLATAISVAAAVPAAVTVYADNGDKPAIYLVGGAAESINPTPEMLANDDFYLGGYGFSSGKAGNVVAIPGVADALGNRYATGILGDGVHSRSFAVSDGAHSIVLSQIETQGYFDAYKQGPFGLNEIRKDASARIAELAAGGALQGNGGHLGVDRHDPAATPPVPSPSEIVVDSDHSHGGPDTAGVWGGVPTSYLKLVHDQTVKSIVEAWQSMRPSVLRYGVAHAGVAGEAQYPPQEGADAPDADWLLNNQFRDDPNNQVMDDEVRVLQAVDPEDEEVRATYVNFSAHPTVLGGDNTKVTGDYVGRLDLQIERAFGGFGMDQVATLGRTQPTDRGCSDPTVASDDDSQNLCALDQYAARVLRKVKMAAAAARPFTGTPTVAMNSYFLSDTTTSGVLAGITYAGTVIGAPAGRAGNAPWYTGSQLGTSLFVGRIGDVLVSGGPGEMYPQIVQKVRDTVSADSGSGIHGFMNIGTAGDFLGYIIAPLEAYPEPAYRSFASHDTTCNGVPDPAAVCPDPIGNDNYFFNISHTFGERLTCDFLRGAGDIVRDDKSAYWSTYDRCSAFVNDYVLDPGQDMQFPEQPDLYEQAHPAFDHM